MTESMKQLVKTFNEIQDYRNDKNADDYEKGQQFGIREALRAFGYGIERDENGFIVALHKGGQIYAA